MGDVVIQMGSLTPQGPQVGRVGPVPKRMPSLEQQAGQIELGGPVVVVNALEQKMTNFKKASQAEDTPGGKAHVLRAWLPEFRFSKPVEKPATIAKQL